MTSVLALDVGTSSVRARVYDERGRHDSDSEAQIAYAGCEDPEALVEAARAVLARSRAAGGPVAAAGVSCFWHSLLAVDGRGRPLTPVLGWSDTRSAAQAERLTRVLGAEEVHARTGCYPHGSYWPAKLAWLAETEPDLFRSAGRFLSFPDYLQLRLAGDARTSLSMASGTGLLDLEGCCWDGPLLEALGLDAGRLPEISDEPAGTDEPWFPALGDGACSNVGVGCVTRERAALTIGTSGAYRAVFEAERAEPRRGLFLYRLDRRRLVEGGSLSDGGNLYAWLRRTLQLAAGTGDLGERPADGHGLSFLALLGGERSPGWNPRARGAIAGLSFATTPEDLLQAALEGVAYRFAEIADLMPEVREVVATGHALEADPGWTRILADVLGRPVTVSAVEESSVRGAAVVALERLGGTPDPAPLGNVLVPREDRAETYRVARKRLRDLYRGVT